MVYPQLIRGNRRVNWADSVCTIGSSFLYPGHRPHTLQVDDREMSEDYQGGRGIDFSLSPSAPEPLLPDYPLINRETGMAKIHVPDNKISICTHGAWTIPVPM